MIHYFEWFHAVLGGVIERYMLLLKYHKDFSFSFGDLGGIGANLRAMRYGNVGTAQFLAEVDEQLTAVEEETMQLARNLNLRDIFPNIPLSLAEYKARGLYHYRGYF